MLALVFERGADARFSARAVLAILYLAYPVTVGCYLGLFWLLKRVDATLVSMGVILETAVGVFAGSWILGEVLELRVWFGLGLVAASVAVLALPGRVWRRPPADPVLP